MAMLNSQIYSSRLDWDGQTLGEAGHLNKETASEVKEIFLPTKVD